MRAAGRLVGFVLVLALLGGAQAIHRLAPVTRLTDEQEGSPFAPEPAVARMVFLGYNELGADLMYIRTRVYYGGRGTTASSLRSLVDAVVALDPHHEPIYNFGARGIGFVDGGTTQDDMRWTARLLEKGVAAFPDSWKLARLCGEVYLLDLETDDPDQRAAWDRRGAELLEKAVHAPGAPPYLGTLLANTRSQLGQHERAKEGLLELIRTTDSAEARQKLVEKLAKLEQADAYNLAQEELWMKDRFDRRWKAALPEATADMYILLGDPPPPYIDFADLAAVPGLHLDDDVYEPIPE